MSKDTAQNRLYHDLAWIWPHFGTAEEYREETLLFSALLKNHAQREIITLLDLGCGGGKHCYTFKEAFEVHGVDISEEMLLLAQMLNPDCTFSRGDMRNLVLDRVFDAVFINDASMYMKTRKELAGAVQSAWRHLKPGGTMLVSAEMCTETFRQNNTAVNHYDAGEGRVVTIIENDYDPDPDDEQFDATFIYMIRENGTLRVEEDRHVCGLFTLDTWRDIIRETGFALSETMLDLEGGVVPTFIGTKPLETDR